MGNSVYIDGCNVAECEFIGKYKICKVYCNNPLGKPCGCEYNPDCYFKQLQRLKDKSEKISYRFKQTKKANKQYKIDIKNLQAELEQYKKSAVRELKATDKIEFKQYYKAENERLQAENEKLKSLINMHLTTFDKCCMNGLIMSNNMSEVLNEQNDR